jgi:hypothetical protein
MVRRWMLLTMALLACRLWAGDKPRFTASGELHFPAHYREWVFLSSGLGMTYGNSAARANANPSFTNVFVNPAAHKAFLATGRWPEGTMFVLEIRRSSSEGSINRGGAFQSRIAAIELEVKDSQRFPQGWAFFDFAGGEQPVKSTAAALGPKATCQPCHSANGAVENTFVQFYPTLLPVARKKGTLKAGFEAMAGAHAH